MYHGASAEIVTPLNKKLYFDKAQFWYSIESVIQHQWEISKLVRGVIRRSFGAGNEEKVFDGIDEDGNVLVRNAATGEILKENISVIAASQIELVAKEMMTHSSSFSAGVKIDDLFAASFNMNFTQSSSSSNSSLGSTSSETKSWGASARMDIAGFGKWLSLDSGTAIDDNGWETWKDSISVSFGFSGGSTSTVKATEFGLTAKPGGSVEIDTETGETLIQEMQNINASGSLFELASCNLTYNAEIFGGYDLTITPPTLYRVQDGEGQWGTDCTDLSKWSYALSGELKDDIKWTIGYHEGTPSLAIATKVGILKSNSESKAKDKLIDWKDNSMYLNIGMNCVKGTGQGGAYEFHPSASVSGNVIGLEYNANLLTGTKYLQKSWSKNFTNSYKDFLSSEGDTFEVNFNLRADWSGGQPVTAGKFVGRADILFRKTICDFNDVAGRLVFEVNAFAQISSGVNSSAILNSKDAGFGLTAGLKWENNILEWFGLPFNLHPSLKVGFAANFMFGGKTRAVGGDQSIPEGASYKNQIVQSKNYEPGGSVTFVMGPIMWDWKPVDTFKQELRRKHNSIFSNIGLGKCPLLNNIGGKEEVWEYILRAGPFRAFGAVNRAQQICGKMRTQEFEDVRQKVSQDQQKMEAALGATYIQAGGRMPLCGVTEAHAGQKFQSCKDALGRQRKKAPYEITKISDNEDMDKCWKELYNDNAFTGAGQGNYKTLREAIYTESLITSYTFLKTPYPCRLTKYQLMHLLIDRMKNFDESFNHCACIEKEFHKLSGDRYWGRVTGVMKYDFAKWDDELQGNSTEMGVINRGFEIIDAQVLALVRAGKDPTDQDTPEGGGDSPAEEFAKNITTEIIGVMNTVDLNSADKAKVKKQLQSTFGDTQRGGFVAWWQDEGICSVPYEFFYFVKNVIGWLYDGLGSLLGGDKDLVDEITKAAYDTSNPCKVAVKTETGTNNPKPGSADNCYEEYTAWRYYQASYGKLLTYLNESHESSGLTQYIKTLHTLWSIPSKGIPFPEYDMVAKGYNCGACQNKKLSLSGSESIVKSSGRQKDLLKAYQAIVGKNLSWASGSNGGILAGTWPFTDSSEVNFEKSLKNLNEGPVTGTSKSSTAMYNASAWINGASDGSRFPMFIDILGAAPDGDSDGWHPCLRGYTDPEWEGAEDKDYTPYDIHPFTTTLETEVCEDSTGGSGTMASGTKCDPDTGADPSADSSHFKSIFKADAPASGGGTFQAAQALAKKMGDPFTGLVGNKAADYVKMIINFLANPALAANNDGPMRSSFWTGAWHTDAAQWSNAYSSFTALHALTADMTGGASPSASKISDFVTKLNTYDSRVGEIDTEGISTGTEWQTADKLFAKSAHSFLKIYKEVFRVILKQALIKKLCSGDPVLGSIAYADYANNRDWHNGNAQPTSAGINDYAQWIYEIIYDGTYDIAVPDLNWVLFSQNVAGIPTSTYANAAAVRSAWNSTARQMLMACFKAIDRDGYMRQYGQNTSYYSAYGKARATIISDIKSNTLNITKFKMNPVDPQGGGNWNSKVANVAPLNNEWKYRNAAMLYFGSGFYLYGYGCNYHNYIYDLNSSAALAPWAMQNKYIEGKGQSTYVRYFPMAHLDWVDKGVRDGDGVMVKSKSSSRYYSLYLFNTGCD